MHLKRLEEFSVDELRPGFKLDLKDLKKKILDSPRLKQVCGKTLTGVLLAEYV